MAKKTDPPEPVVKGSLADSLKRYGDHPTPAQAKRLRKQIMRAYGQALLLSGSAKTARVNKLAKIAPTIPGLTVTKEEGKLPVIFKTPPLKLSL
jgi:hypothetical protein